jgi:hypothetical protein
MMRMIRLRVIYSGENIQQGWGVKETSVNGWLANPVADG